MKSYSSKGCTLFEIRKNMANKWENLKDRIVNKGSRELSLFERKWIDRPGFWVNSFLNNRCIDKQEKILGKIDGKINGAMMSITARRRALEIETNMLMKMRAKVAGDAKLEKDIDDQIAAKKDACDDEIKRIQTDQIDNLKSERENQKDRKNDFVNERNRLINEMHSKVQGDIDNIETKLGLSAVKQAELAVREKLNEKKKEIEVLRKEYNDLRSEIEELKAMGANVGSMKAPLKLAWGQLKDAEKERASVERQWNKSYDRIVSINKKTQGWYSLKDSLGLVAVNVAESSGAKEAKEKRQVEDMRKKSSPEQLVELKKIKEISTLIESKGILYKQEISPADMVALKDKITSMGFDQISTGDIDSEIDAKIIEYRNKIKDANEKRIAHYSDDEKIEDFKNNPIMKKVMGKLLEDNRWLSPSAMDINNEAKGLGYILSGSVNQWDSLKNTALDMIKEREKNDISKMDEAGQINNLKTKDKKLFAGYLKSNGFFIPDGDPGLKHFLADKGYTKIDQNKIATFILDSSKNIISKMKENVQVNAIILSGGYLDRLSQSRKKFANAKEFNNEWPAIQAKIRSIGFDNAAHPITARKWTEIENRAKALLIG